MRVAGCLAEKMPGGSLSRGEQMPVQPQLGHYYKSPFAGLQSFCSKYPRLVLGDFQFK